MKIATVIGARPQFIKASMVSREISKYDDIEEIIIHTGQHFDEKMSNIFFEEMEVPEPDYNLDIHSLPHGAMTGRQLEEIEKLLIKEKPDWVLVYGDTNSTLAGSLAAAKLQIPLAHVEAGLRSFNRNMPEEVNRVLTDHISDLLFTPTDAGFKNLRDEGIKQSKIEKVGDVMYDAALHFGQMSEKKSTILDKYDLKSKNYILSTIHRQENTENPVRLKNIISALSEAPFPVVMPLHPRTKKKLAENNITLNGQILSIEPVGYIDMVMLEKNANKIATDSGGMQKEAFFYEIPCITIRDETEWVELVEMGVNKVVGASIERIHDAFNISDIVFEKNAVYGTGNTSKQIVRKLEKYNYAN